MGHKQFALRKTRLDEPISLSILVDQLYESSKINGSNLWDSNSTIWGWLSLPKCTFHSFWAHSYSGHTHLTKRSMATSGNYEFVRFHSFWPWIGGSRACKLGGRGLTLVGSDKLQDACSHWFETLVDCFEGHFTLVSLFLGLKFRRYG